MWSEAQQRWVHLDACEAAYDKPLLYEVRRVPRCGAEGAAIMASWHALAACRHGRHGSQGAPGLGLAPHAGRLGQPPVLAAYTLGHACAHLQAGWGKRLNYVVAVGRHGATDVTRRYCRDFADALKQ